MADAQSAFLTTTTAKIAQAQKKDTGMPYNNTKVAQVQQPLTPHAARQFVSFDAHHTYDPSPYDSGII